MSWEAFLRPLIIWKVILGIFHSSNPTRIGSVYKFLFNKLYIPDTRPIFGQQPNILWVHKSINKFQFLSLQQLLCLSLFRFREFIVRFRILNFSALIVIFRLETVFEMGCMMRLPVPPSLTDARPSVSWWIFWWQLRAKTSVAHNFRERW